MAEDPTTTAQPTGEPRPGQPPAQPPDPVPDQVSDLPVGPSGRRRRLARRLAGWRDRVRRNRALDLSWRVGVFVVGAACVLAGVIMLVTPGPGWVAIIVGLAVLATEFEWADGLLRWARAKARAATAQTLDPAVRRRNILIGLAVVVLAVAAAVWWVVALGWPAPVRPAVDWLRGLP